MKRRLLLLIGQTKKNTNPRAVHDGFSNHVTNMMMVKAKKPSWNVFGVGLHITPKCRVGPSIRMPRNGVKFPVAASEEKKYT